MLHITLVALIAMYLSAKLISTPYRRTHAFSYTQYMPLQINEMRRGTKHAVPLV